MKIIGITGGVGAGKSAVLDIIKDDCNCYILLADQAAHEVKKRGTVCYDELVSLLGGKVLAPDGEIDKARMAAAIFDEKDRSLLDKVNGIIHPRVREYILDKIKECRREGKVDYFFLEAALLIEEGYKEVCDELWYIYAPVSVRADRLKRNRSYSDEKIRAIMASQSDEETFKRNCDRMIDNGSDLEGVRTQIHQILSGER